MCLSIPGKVLSIDNNIAQVDIQGTTTKASLKLLKDVNPGDYVLVHTGFAIQKYDIKEAEETLSLYRELLDQP